MAFGKAQYGNTDGTRKKILEIPKDEKTVLRARVLPPMLKQERTGRWIMQHKQHFGYSTTKVGDDGKSRTMYNTFGCIEEFDFRAKKVTAPCPACDAISDNKTLLENTVNALKAKGKTDAEIDTAVAPLRQWVDSHNLDKKFYLNVKTMEGEYGTLKIPFKAKEKLDQLIEEYAHPKNGRKPIDALDVEQGLWFEFSRKGKGRFGTSYDVKVVTEVINHQGQEYERPKLAPLTEQDAVAAEAACYDISDVGIRKLAKDKVLAVVNAKSPEEIDAIFMAPNRERSSSAEVSSAREASPAPVRVVDNAIQAIKNANEAMTELAKAPVQEKPRDVVQAPANVEDELAKALALVKALEAKAKEQATNPTPPVTPAARVDMPSTDELLNMPEDQFLARFAPKS